MPKKARAPKPAEPKVSWRAPFTPMFWLTYGVTLLITLPIPLVSLQIQQDGEVIGTRNVPIYECYTLLFEGLTTAARRVHPTIMMVVVSHLFIPLFIAYWIYRAFITARRREEVARARPAKTARDDAAG